MDIHHETLVMERHLTASPARVFQAFADPREREAWSTPGPSAEVRIDASDMRTGGSERARCGTRGAMQWSVQTFYHYVEPGAALTFSEVVSEGGAILTTALVTFAFSPGAGGGTLLRLTDQVTSFVGAQAVFGHRIGYSQALDNLADALATRQ